MYMLNYNYVPKCHLLVVGLINEQNQSDHLALFRRMLDKRLGGNRTHCS